jgi:DNA-binding response OmpR family regulator
MESKTHILIVDDEPAVRYFLRRVLERDGHTVSEAESGEDALKLAATGAFDLALIDLKLKGIGGLQVIAELRRLQPNTPAIVLTAHASLESAVEALRQGAHDYLFKPCTTVDLRASVNSALLKRQSAPERNAGATPSGAPAAAAPDPSAAAQKSERFLQYGTLIVDPLRHVITLDGKLLELSPTEFSLLAYLVGEAPRVVSSEELVREVQGYASEAWEARETVRSHIYHIRSKTRAAANREVIRTVRGIGYTVVE